MKRISREIQKKRLFLLDIDGTISYDATLYDGTKAFIKRVLELEGKYIFITNNSTKSIEDYIIKFEHMKIPVDESNFFTSSSATAIYLKQTYQNSLIYVMGTESFIRELKKSGLNITQEAQGEIAAVVVGFDSELTYAKIETTCQLLETKKVDYIATNPDLVCPTGFGFVPDCGAICSMLQYAVKKTPIYIGKPNPIMVELSLKRTGFLKEQTLVIGDRLYTDIACGINAGVDTAVVFTGEAKKEDLKTTKFPPTYYCDSIKDIWECLI